jgi:hypothetical protein
VRTSPGGLTLKKNDNIIVAANSTLTLNNIDVYIDTSAWTGLVGKDTTSSVKILGLQKIRYYNDTISTPVKIPVPSGTDDYYGLVSNDDTVEEVYTWNSGLIPNKWN